MDICQSRKNIIIEHVEQETSWWCWIASALMFVKHYFPDFGGVTRITQYNCAYYYFLRDQDYEGTVDDMPGSLKEAIDYYFNTEGYALPKEELNMRKLLYFVFAMIFILSGCNASTINSIIEEDGKYYMIVDFYYSPEEVSDAYINGGGDYIEFETIDEMISDIKTQNFNEDEWDYIRYMMEKGSNRVPIPNIYDLYIRVLPETAIAEPITWWLNSYRFEFTLDNGYGGLMEKYDDYTEYLEDLPPSVSETTPTLISKEQEEDRNATVYTIVDLLGYTRIYKSYQIVANDKTIMVEECYNPEISRTVPTEITMVVDANGIYYRVFLNNMTANERPSAE